MCSRTTAGAHKSMGEDENYIYMEGKLFRPKRKKRDKKDNETNAVKKANKESPVLSVSDWD